MHKRKEHVNKRQLIKIALTWEVHKREMARSHERKRELSSKVTKREHQREETIYTT